jgi:hypothetical protein
MFRIKTLEDLDYYIKTSKIMFPYYIDQITIAIRNSELIFIDTNHLIISNKLVTIYPYNEENYFFINALTKEKLILYNGDITTLIPKAIPIRNEYNIIIGYWNLKDIQSNIFNKYCININYTLPFPEKQLKVSMSIGIDLDPQIFQDTIIWQYNKVFHEFENAHKPK